MESFSYDENYSYVYDDELIPICEVDDYRITKGVCYATIFCLSILGNGFLLCALTCYEDLKRATNPSCIYGSLILLTAMTLDRFIVVVMPRVSYWLTRSRRLKCSKVACIGAWIISLIACRRDLTTAKDSGIFSLLHEPSDIYYHMMHGEMSQKVFNISYDYNYTYEDYYPLVTFEEENFSLNIISAICYTLIICISLPGNIFLLWVVLKKVGLSSSADCLLFHLTISDLIFTLTLVPWTVNHIWGWIFGHLACKLFTLYIFLGLYSYMMFITVMTVHRYVAVVYPVFASSVGNRRLYTHISSAVAWWISVSFSLLEMVFSETVDGPDGVFCISNYNSMFTELFVSFTQIVLFFLLPFLIIVFCHTRMGFAILQSRSRSRNHTVCIILSIAVGFFICWAPYNIFLFLVSLRSLGVFAFRESFWEIIYCIIHILAYSHCCLNPLIHIFGGKKFRNYLPWSRGFRRLT
ncbi:hypothetical protein QQF64_015595 [Cirrhinus molitorella]|uniref:G-protein coupled receptors family 1 profile domain-containing protein n=1 Tax=Cirrhinus molitorella TaxID=172907 RepID=A0ABR3NVD5_9TELE